MASRAPVSGFRRFSTALSSAVLEWILMCLLFFDAMFSYLVTKFSRLCKLQTPCIFCSRLDHIFGNEKPGFYLDLICETHISEISSLAFDNVHGNLADVHTMCQGCLLSFATESKSSPETYRSLVSKLRGHFDHSEDIEGVDGDGFHEDDLANAPFLKKDVELHAIRSFEDKSIRVNADEVDIPLSSSAGHSYLQNEDGVRKTREKTLVSPTNYHSKNQGFDRFSHVGYSEVKITSDSDSEVPLTDDDERKSLSYGDENIKDDLVSHNVESESVAIIKNSLSGSVSNDRAPEMLTDSAPVSVSDDKALEKLVHCASVINEPSESIPEKQVNVGELHDISILSSSGSAEHCLEDSNLNQVEVKAIPPQSEFVPQDSHEVLAKDSTLKDNLELNDTACFCTTSIDDAKDWCATDIDLMTSRDASFSVSDDKALEKLIHSAQVVNEPFESTSEKQINVGELHDKSTFSSSIASGHCLEDRNWNQIEVKAILPQSEFGPQDSQEVLIEDSDVKDNLELSDASCVRTTSIDDAKDCYATDINLRTSHDASEPGQSTTTHMDLNDAYKLAVGTKGRLPSPRFTEVLMVKDSSRVQEDLRSESSQSMSTHMDLNDAYKLAVGTKGSLPSPRFTEVLMGKDSSRVHEDLKLLISQISAARGLESPWNEITPSPRAYGQGDESVLQNITKTLSLERNESGLESLDGSIVSEVEGESAVERLKRQIELDRKSISLLYKELEEESSASAIAANQAMAMITRLQEEKAAMQMEALQYQRMMEEQAEYDHEALQKCNDLLSQREKEIQDLEAEVEGYRKHSANELCTEKTVELSGNFHDKEVTLCNESGETNLMYQKSRLSELGELKDPLSCFEDEEAYISNCLTKLEKKLQLFSNNDVYDEGSSFNLNDDDENGIPDKTCADIQGENAPSEDGVGSNGQYSNEVGVLDMEQLHQKDGPLEINEVRKSMMLEEKTSKKGSGSFEGNHGDSFDFDKQYLLKLSNKNDLVALENEVSRLSQRLETLEADRNFLEYAINTLRNGDDGVRFIQEIACDLRELRRIVISQRERLIA